MLAAARGAAGCRGGEGTSVGPAGPVAGGGLLESVPGNDRCLADPGAAGTTQPKCRSEFGWLRPAARRTSRPDRGKRHPAAGVSDRWQSQRRDLVDTLPHIRWRRGRPRRKPRALSVNHGYDHDIYRRSLRERNVTSKFACGDSRTAPASDAYVARPKRRSPTCTAHAAFVSAGKHAKTLTMPSSALAPHEPPPQTPSLLTGPLKALGGGEEPQTFSFRSGCVLLPSFFSPGLPPLPP